MTKCFFPLVISLFCFAFSKNSFLTSGQQTAERKFLFKSKFDTSRNLYGSHIEVREVLPVTHDLIRLDIDDRDKISRSGYSRADCINILGEYLTFQGDTTKSNKKFMFRPGYYLILPQDTVGYTIQIEALFSFTWMLTQGYPPIRPTLIDRATGLHLNKDVKAIREVYDIYSSWYNENKATNFKPMKLPLEGTPYTWSGEDKGLQKFFPSSFFQHLEKQ